MSPKAPDKPARKSARKPAKVAEPRLEVTVAEDLSRATLTFLPASGVAGSLDLSLSQITTLIQHLGNARSRLVANAPIPPITGAAITPVFATQWAVQPEALTEGSVIAFQHPAYGPVGFVLQAAEAQRVVRALTNHLAMVHSSEAAPGKPS